MKLRFPKIKLSLPVKLILVVVVCMLFGDLFSESIKSTFYSISISIRDVLVFVLPAIIFSYIFACILSLNHRSYVFIALLIGVLALSNFVTTMMAYGIGTQFIHYSSDIIPATANTHESLRQLWTLGLPEWIPNDVALFSGLFLAVIASVFKVKYTVEASVKMRDASNFILQKCLIPVVPLFVFGFVLNLSHQKILKSTFSQYGPLVCMLIFAMALYTTFLYALNSGFRLKPFFKSVRNAIPSAIMAFSTLSSAVTMPLTMQAAEKNSGDTEKARAIIPLTVNIHLIGTCFGMIILSLGILASYGMPLPDFETFFAFSLMFVVTMFAVSAVPGGGVFIVAPLLEQFFNFTPEMLSLLAALYLLFDAFITTTNVLGNGIFACLYMKFYKIMMSKLPNRLQAQAS